MKKLGELRERAHQARFAMLANQAGFVIKGDMIKPRWNPAKLTEIFGTQEAVLIKGATAEVLEGSSVKQSLKTTGASVAALGPLGLIGSGREIAVQVTAADGSKIIGTTSKKNLVAAHRFCAALTQYR